MLRKKYKDLESLREAILWAEKNAETFRISIWSKKWEVSVQEKVNGATITFDIEDKDLIKAVNKARIKLEELKK